MLIMGDIHGRFGDLNTLISKRNPDIFFQCGDFGYWPNFAGRSYIDSIGKIRKYEWNNKLVKANNTKGYWCDGNHEYHPGLLSLENNEIFPNIFYQKRGSYLTLPNGFNVLFMGGALSVDKNQRTIGDDWFPEETITQKDIYNLPEVEIDIVISHTCPREFYPFIENDLPSYYGNYISKSTDSSMDALSYVLKKYRPKLWFFGHFHLFKQGYNEGCHWTCLSCVGSDERWWIELEIKETKEQEK